MWTTLDLRSPAHAGAPPRLVGRNGEVIDLDLGRWLGEPTTAERRLLDRVEPPVLDVGCGPGRLVADLRRRGTPVLGIDVAPGAVSLARERGASALRCSVFDDVLDGWRWRTALLVDGNVGIGGDPMRLFRRVRELLDGSGLVLAEVEPPGVATRTLEMRLETATGCSAWFGWARVGVDGLGPLAAATGFTLSDVWCDQARWFALLHSATRRPAGDPHRG
ncbi:MAG: methyltransferase domain-containing protein [Egibacteraceae bacterium]